MSAPLPVLRSSDILLLYSSSPAPEGWNFTVTVCPLAFWSASKRGMTQLLIHSALAAFLPPAIPFAAMVSVNVFASAFLPESVLLLLPRQPVEAATVTSNPATPAMVRRAMLFLSARPPPLKLVCIRSPRSEGRFHADHDPY